MKTYNKTIQSPQLEIRYEQSPGNPRTFMDNLGFFIVQSSRYNSPDNHGDLQEIIKNTGELAKNTKDHIDMIKRSAKTILGEQDEKIIAIYPINMYDHSGVSYSLGNRHGFDYSNNGFYIITNRTQKNFGTKPKDFEKIIKQELDVYNSYVNGNVFEYQLFDKKGNEIDAGSGFYSIEEIRDNLPDEWTKENLTDYLIN